MFQQKILITGVGQRIGLFLAMNLIKSDYQVIGTYRTERPSLDILRDQGVELHRCDFYQEQEVQQFIDDIRERHTQLRAIIHNASDWLPDKSDFAEVIDKMMRVHVHAPYLMNLALAPLLVNNDSEFSDIIHFSDYVASTGSAKHSAYAASKAALDNLSLSFATRLAPKVKVNSIAPALVVFNDDDDQDYRDKAVKKNLIPREAGLAEIIRAVIHLLDSRYITGRVLPVDGGRHLAKGNI